VKEEFDISVNIPVFVERVRAQKEAEEAVWDPLHTIL
jgi:hypothetical protein